MTKIYKEGSSKPLMTTKYIQGTSSYVALILEPNTLTLVSDVNGNVTFDNGGEPIYYTYLRLYYRGAEVNINDYTIGFSVSTGSGITYTTTASGNSMKISLTAMTAAIDYGTLTCSITLDGKTIKNILTVAKLKQGETGLMGATGPGYYAELEGNITTVASGTITPTLKTNLGYSIGQRVILYNSSPETPPYMLGRIISYNSSTGASSITIDYLSGSAGVTLSGWTINLAGEDGEQGIQGEDGPSFYTGVLSENGSTTISVGSIGLRTFVCAESNLGWSAGQPFMAKPLLTITSNTNYIYGYVSSYTEATRTLVVNVTQINGAGSYEAWSGNLVGEIGPQGATGATGGATAEFWTELTPYTSTGDFYTTVTYNGLIRLNYASATVKDKIDVGTVIKFQRGDSSNIYYGIVSEVGEHISGYYCIRVAGPAVTSGVSIVKLWISNSVPVIPIDFHIPGELNTLLGGATSGNVLTSVYPDGIQICEDKFTWTGPPSYLVNVFAGLHIKDSTYNTSFNIVKSSTNLLIYGNHTAGESTLNTVLDDALTTLEDWRGCINSSVYRFSPYDSLTITVDIANAASKSAGLNVRLIFVRDTK